MLATFMVCVTIAHFARREMVSEIAPRNGNKQ